VPNVPAPVQRELINTLIRFRKETDRRDASTIKQLADAYGKLFRRLNGELELELRRIFDKPESIVTRAYIRHRLESLTESVQSELEKYQAFLSTTIDTTADAALLAGSRDAVELMRLATLGRKAITGINFSTLNPAQINTMIGFLSPGSTLFKRIEQIAKFHAPVIRDQLIDGIALGFGPSKTAGNIAPFLKQIASEFKIDMARPFADAVRMARTSMLWSYREATRANYQANADVVSGWSWFATLDAVTCPACLSLHGTVHELDEPLEGHYHCRCTPVPIVLGQPFVQEGAGQDWFNKQNADTQQSILGKGAFDAWQAGKFDFSQLSRRVDDDTYGGMQVVTPLKDLVFEDE